MRHNDSNKTVIKNNENELIVSIKTERKENEKKKFI